MLASTNENILEPLEVQNPGDQNFGKVNLNTEMSVYPGKSNVICFATMPAIILGILIWLDIKFILDGTFNYIATIVFSSIAFIFLAIIILVLGLNPLKYTFTKDLYSNFLHVRKINYFCCSLERCDFNLKDIIVDIIPHGKSAEKNISIVNTHQDFNINTFNIAKIPPKLYYIIEDVGESDSLKNQLCEFIGCPLDAENPVQFDINKFLGKPIEKKLPFTLREYGLSQYMKINNNYFTFYLNLSKFSFWGGLFPFAVFFNLAFIVSLVVQITNEVIPGIIVFGILVIIINILFVYCVYCYNKRMRRIDIIFSNDFNKIFIGLINDKENKYLNYFIFDIINIDEFILESKNQSSSDFNLKIVLKDKTIQNICRIDENRGTLEGLLYILNNYKKVPA